MQTDDEHYSALEYLKLHKDGLIVWKFLENEAVVISHYHILICFK
jgi:hypothetical protein